MQLKVFLQLFCRYILSFLKEHGKEVYLEVRAAYIDTMNKVKFHFILFILNNFASLDVWWID